jgi:hypothetical protein
MHIPPGCAHGYQTLADDTEVFYFVSAPYSPPHQRGVRWNDPAFGIEWPLGAPGTIPPRDAATRMSTGPAADDRRAQDPRGSPSSRTTARPATTFICWSNSKAGLVLTGTEVKAAREGRVNLREAFCRLEGGEAYLLNAHIGQYSHGGYEP